MLSALIEKVGTMQEQMGNIGREMETLRKNRMEMLEIENTVTEMRDPFDGLISGLDMAEERITELEKTSVETCQTEVQREKRMKETTG